MVLGKRTREHSTDSNDKPISSSPLRKMQEDDVSGVESMLRRRKQPKTTPVSSSSNNKMNWTKDDELIILGSIVDYEKETKLSHRSDWDAFYGYVKDFIEAEFSKKQLTDKIRNLNKRFLGNKARCDDEEGPSFTDTEDDIIFKLSVIIWDSTNETVCDSDENVDQGKVDAPCVEHEKVSESNMDQAKDVPCVEHEPVDENMDPAKDLPCVEDERVDKNVDQGKVLDLDKDAPAVEHEPTNENMDLDQEKDALTDKDNNEEDGVDEFCAMKDALADKEKSEEDSADEYCALKDALEETTFFQSIGKYQQKALLQNLKNLRGPRRKELADELKDLLDEEMKVRGKKLSLSAKLASAWEESC
ncbi:GLABROUS1 enhancer-binding protein-like 3 isoform X6 [Brassica rapa]|uniref:GLABROUS1 enhancer-binding protein-like 3 isoform X6 n=1 Tax=Brassica campestris TaxID=3711 RepID=UPI00142DC231|nr:GLABROUS1 enhancer-binding protein-like 3 isoform X6 [Brassica rapa]